MENKKFEFKKEFVKLKNGQQLKIVFSYWEETNTYYMTIVAGNNRRQCNDCMYKTRKSPKSKFGKSTGNNLGIEPFIVALHKLLEFEKTIKKGRIEIVGASERLTKVYKVLTRYGYKIEKSKSKKKDIIVKVIG